MTKEIFLQDEHPVVYQRHTVDGFIGPTSVGHHAILAMPDDQESVAISTSPFRQLPTDPGVFSRSVNGEYQVLAVGESFSDLAEIPTLFKKPGVVDATHLPFRRGFSDLFAVVADTSALDGKPAWTAVNTKEHGCGFHFVILISCQRPRSGLRITADTLFLGMEEINVLVWGYMWIFC